VRKFQTLVAAAVAATLLAGCGGGGTATPAASGDASSAPAGGSGETLVVYTNSNGEGRGEWWTQKAAEAGYKIEIVGAGGADATNKLIAEKNNPIADVAFGLNNMYFSQVKAQNALEPYEPAWAGEVDKELGDGETYWPLVKQAILLGYNSDKLSKDAAPQDWTDLWTKDELKDRYERVTGLGTATAQLVFAGILSRYRDDAGDLGISDEGWKQVEQYFQNGSPAVAKTDLFARIASGEVDMGQMPSSIIAEREKSFGVNVETVIPSVGVPLAVEQIALVKGTEKKEQAQKFIDWFGSAKVQGEFAKKFNSMPVNKAAEAEANPEVVAFFADLKQQDIDWEFVQENMGAWVEKIELEYMT